MSQTASNSYDTRARALSSSGSSSGPIHRMVLVEIESRQACGARVVDVGCGTGLIRSALSRRFNEYLGVDVVRHAGYPADMPFVEFDVDQGGIPVEDGCADCVISVETIEHVENPRFLFRELVRLVRPGGLVVVTTPNQLNLVSLASLLVRSHFDAFVERPGNYPAHITALLPLDLVRIATECGLSDIQIRFSNDGRVPILDCKWPFWLTGRAFSDNVLVGGRKPETLG